MDRSAGHHDVTFGGRVRARREALGLTLRDVARQGGPSARTLLAVEQDAGRRLRNDTLHRLDEVLRWPEGTAATLSSGAEARSGDALHASGVQLSLAEVSDLVRWAATLVAARQREGPPAFRPAENEALDHLGALASRLFREATTEIGGGSGDPVAALRETMAAITLLESDLGAC